MISLLRHVACLTGPSVFWPSDVEVMRDSDGSLIVNNYLLDDVSSKIAVPSAECQAYPNVVDY